MNKSDSERFAAGLEGMGLAPAERIEQADVIVVHTCSLRPSATASPPSRGEPTRSSGCSTASKPPTRRYVLSCTEK